jgi:hypothetical protein
MDQYDRSAEGSRQEQRLIDVYYEWQAGNTLAPDPLANLPARRQADLEPIPDDLEPQDLLDGYSDRLSPEQIRWLEDWNRQLEEVSDGARTIEDIEDPVAQNAAYQLYERYDTWRETNRLSADPLENLFDDLEPDPTAVANQRAGLPAPVEVSPARQNELYRNYVDNLDIDADGLTVQDLAELIRGNDTVGTPNTTEVERNALAALVEEYGLRDNFDPVPVEPQAFAAGPLANELYDMDVEQGVANVQSIENTIYALRNGVIDHQAFRELPENRRQDAMDLVADMVQARLTEQAAVEPPAPRQALQVAQRDPVPRHIRNIGAFTNMSPAWNRQAQELADMYFNDNVIDGTNVSIGSLTGMLRDYRIGPHADAPNEVRELAARMLEGRHAVAQVNAEEIADSLNEAFYMDMDPVEAADQINRDIAVLERNGENTWEDFVGPMVEDIPWNRNVQHHLIGYLRALAEQYVDMRRAEDPDGFAKGGMVKKKHMAKKDGMPLILTRKSPELTELAYQYGGIVG